MENKKSYNKKENVTLLECIKHNNGAKEFKTLFLTRNISIPNYILNIIGATYLEYKIDEELCKDEKKIKFSVVPRDTNNIFKLEGTIHIEETEHEKCKLQYEASCTSKYGFVVEKFVEKVYLNSQKSYVREIEKYYNISKVRL